MDSNNERNEHDELSEMLNMNKERKMNKAEDNTDDILDSAGSGASMEDNDDELRDIEFSEEASEETENIQTEKKSRRIREAERQLKKQSRRRRTVIQIVLGAVLSGVVIFFGFKMGNKLLNAVFDYTGINASTFEIVVEIPENPTAEQVAQVLEENGIISDASFFELYLKLKNEENDFVGGEFTLSSAMNYGTIVNTLLASKIQVITVEVTIIEGMTASEIGALLEENAVCKAEDFVQFYRNKIDVYDFERRVLQSSLKFNQLEGYLFPDKYEFYVVNELLEDPDADIDTTDAAEAAAEKIYSNFNSKITKAMYKQMNEMGLTLDELITLASMVQAEAGNADDMYLVASVFLNRLNNSEDFPKLQSDATVFYVQEDIEPYYEDSGISVSLEAISNAYDTYVVSGIPAGPICNPGMDAINAVLNAPETDYFYFCANAETGETYFASTVEENEANLVLAGLA